jgi:hypothetical protein
MRVYPTGLSLLLTLFVLSAILVAALSASTIIVREFKITGTSDRGTQAFYLAESGLEDALYAYRYMGRKDLTVDPGSAVNMGKGKWWRDSSEPVTGFDLSLTENQVVELVLFDPADGAKQAESIRLAWSNNSAVCPGADFTWLEVVQSYWDGNLSQSSRSILSPSEAGGSIVNLLGSFPSVRVRALYGDACNLSVTAYQGPDGKGGTFALPTQLQITATGQVRDTQQTLSIIIPVLAAQFSAFDYTIFSEQAICKFVSPCD